MDEVRRKFEGRSTRFEVDWQFSIADFQFARARGLRDGKTGASSLRSSDWQDPKNQGM